MILYECQIYCLLTWVLIMLLEADIDDRILFTVSTSSLTRVNVYYFIFVCVPFISIR